MTTIHDDIEKFYKDLKNPDFSRIQKQFDKGFPKLLLEKLNDLYWIKNGTDVNTDAGFFISLLSENELFLLMYSFVSDCFHIIQLEKSEHFDSAPTYKVLKHLSNNDDLVKFCINFLPKGSQYFDREKLITQIDFNWNEEGYHSVPLYKILFMQEGELPYFENR